MCKNKNFNLTTWDGQWHEIDTIEDTSTHKKFGRIAALYEDTENYKLINNIFPKKDGKYEIFVCLELKYPKKNIRNYPWNYCNGYHLYNTFDNYIKAKEWVDNWSKDGKDFANNLDNVTHEKLLEHYKEINDGKLKV